jgi:hypothetical protein
MINGASIKATVRSRECTVIYRSKIEIVGANSPPGREISFRSLCCPLYRGADKSLARRIPDVFCLMVRLFRLMLVLLYT